MDNKYNVIILKQFLKFWEDEGLDEKQLDDFKKYLIKNINKGDLIVGTGGCRKIRIKLNNNKGKSGGARCIYMDYKHYNTLLLIKGFSKTNKENLDKKEITQIKKLIKELALQLKRSGE